MGKSSIKQVKHKRSFGIKRYKSGPKIKAKKVEIDGIKFDSSLNGYGYKELKRAGIQAIYEKETLCVLEGFEFEGKKVRGIHYTPDFFLDEDKIILELKGFCNEAFPLREKLFKAWLSSTQDIYKGYKYVKLKNQDQIDSFIFKVKKGDYK